MMWSPAETSTPTNAGPTYWVGARRPSMKACHPGVNVDLSTTAAGRSRWTLARNTPSGCGHGSVQEAHRVSAVVQRVDIRRRKSDLVIGAPVRTASRVDATTALGAGELQERANIVPIADVGFALDVHPLASSTRIVISF